MMEDSERLVSAARAFAVMPPVLVATRGADVIRDDFVYSSPQTGELDRAAYLRLMRIVERASPDLTPTVDALKQGAAGTGKVYCSGLGRSETNVCA